jgi:hypothetical protein
MPLVLNSPFWAGISGVIHRIPRWVDAKIEHRFL